jgi:polyisoprenoid-binding protein YceI
MTAPRPSTTSRSWPRILALGVGLAVLAAIAGGTWYLFLRAPAPSAVALGAEPAPTASATAEPTETADAAPPDATATADAEAPAGLDGTWTVDATVGSFEDFSGTFVGYRVQEELVGIGAATAVGRTPDATGSLTLDETSITEASFEANLTTLQSDSGMRDGQLGRQGLETDIYPTATFVLAEPVELGSVPAEGETIQATAVGDLTLHGVTQRVEIPVEARLSSGVVTVVGSLPITFGDYGMTAPESMRVLSIDENGTMEFQLQFTQA